MRNGFEKFHRNWAATVMYPVAAVLDSMALFGRESEADRLRAERVRQWAQGQSPYALFSCLFGILAVLDAFTVVISLVTGPLAIGLGVWAHRDPRIAERHGARWLPKVGMVLGCFGLILTVVVWRRFYAAD